MRHMTISTIKEHEILRLSFRQLEMLKISARYSYYQEIKEPKKNLDI